MFLLVCCDQVLGHESVFQGKTGPGHSGLLLPWPLIPSTSVSGEGGPERAHRPRTRSPMLVVVRHCGGWCYTVPL